MDTITRARHNGNRDWQAPAGTRRLSRRAMLTTTTATAVAGVAGLSAAHADTIPPAAGFGAPLAELHFPVGVLSLEQKAAMIKGVTDVLLKATNLAPEQTSKLWVQILRDRRGRLGRRRPSLRAAPQIGGRDTLPLDPWPTQP